MPADPAPDVFDLVRTILTEQFKVDPAAISAGASLSDLALDSLSAVELVDILEERTSVPFETEKASLSLTVGEIAAHIADSLAAAGPA
jgi:acyl carrier protein